MVYTLGFFSFSKSSLFHNSNVFGSCIIPILFTVCVKIKKKNSGAKRLNIGALLLGHSHCKQGRLAVRHLRNSAVCQPAAGCKERHQLPLQYLLPLRQLCPLLMSPKLLYILIYVCCPARRAAYGVILMLPVANLARLSHCAVAGR